MVWSVCSNKIKKNQGQNEKRHIQSCRKKKKTPCNIILKGETNSYLLIFYMPWLYIDRSSMYGHGNIIFLRENNKTKQKEKGFLKY